MIGECIQFDPQKINFDHNRSDQLQGSDGKKSAVAFSLEYTVDINKELYKFREANNISNRWTGWHPLGLKVDIVIVKPIFLKRYWNVTLRT